MCYDSALIDEEKNKIRSIHTLKIVQTHKLVGVIEKDEGTYI